MLSFTNPTLFFFTIAPLGKVLKLPFLVTSSCVLMCHDTFGSQRTPCRSSLCTMSTPEIELGSSKIDSKCLYLQSTGNCIDTHAVGSWAWPECPYSVFKATPWVAAQSDLDEQMNQQMEHQESSE